MTSLLAGFVLPPLSLLLAALFGLWIAPRRAWGRWLAVAALALLALLAMPICAKLLARPLEAAYPPFDRKMLEARSAARRAVVILGGGQELGALEYPDGERASAISLERARYGARLAHGLGLPIVLSGGSPLGGRQSEAALMRAFIEFELGRPVAVVEERSNDTRENAVYTAETLRRLGFGEVVLVTDAMHMPRAMGAFRAAGMPALPAPMRFQSWSPLRARDLFPSGDGMERTQRALREALGLAWYRLRVG